MKFFFFIFFFSLTAQAEILTFNPFSNKVFLWDGITFTNALESSETYSILFSDSPNYFQAPAPLSHNKFAVTTNKGEIFIINLESERADLFFSSKDACRNDLAFSGCIYSLAITPDNEILYLLHERNGTDSLMKGSRKLVNNIPGPSGPIWIRSNGNIGLLPFGHGIYEITIPKQLKPFSQVLISETPLESMAGAVLEGIWGDETIKTYLFDFFSLKLFTANNQFATISKTSSATFDPCFGQAWFLDGGSIESIALSPNPTACPLTLRWNIEHKTSPKGSNKSHAHLFWDFPRGNRMIPNSAVFSIGYLGELTLVPSKVINNSDGIDIRVFENAFATYAGGKIFAEIAQVEIFDGTDWISTGCNCDNPTDWQCAGMQPTTITPGDGTLPWSEQAGGLGIDFSNFSIERLEKIRLIDCGTIADSGSSGGFDLDAISINPDSIL